MASRSARGSAAVNYGKNDSNSDLACKYEILLDGDTTLTLKNPNAPTPAWKNEKDSLAPVKDSLTPFKNVRIHREPARSFASSTWDNGRPNKRRRVDDQEASSAGSKEAPGIRLRVSSFHLKSASSYFEAMFGGPWSENEKKPGSVVFSVTASDWDERVFVLLMKILHGRVEDVHVMTDWSSLSKLASMVDYYQCHHVVKFYVQACLTLLESKGQVPGEELVYTSTLVQELAFYCTFGPEMRSERQRDIIACIIAQACSPMQTLGLPIPLPVSNYVDMARNQLVDELVERMLHCVSLLSQRQRPSLDQMNTMHFGAITQVLHAAGLLFNQPRAPYEGLSFGSIRRMLISMRCSELCYPSSTRRVMCFLDIMVDPRVSSHEDALKLLPKTLLDSLYLGQRLEEMSLNAK